MQQPGYNSHNGYQQQPTPPPPYTPTMNPIPGPVNQPNGTNQMGMIGGMPPSSHGNMGINQGINQMNPMGMYSQPLPNRGGPRRRKSAAPFGPTPPIANAMSPPGGPLTPGSLNSPYMSISEGAGPIFNYTKGLQGMAPSPNGLEDVKPRLRPRKYFSNVSPDYTNIESYSHKLFI